MVFMLQDDETLIIITNLNAIISLYALGQRVTATHMAPGVQVAAIRSMMWLHGCDIKHYS
jgi:hypothetical protein